MSSDEQVRSGGGLAAQRRAILAEAERRGWELVDVIEDAGYSAKDLRRPGLTLALEQLRSGDASALVVAKMDRLSRSLVDCAGIMQTAQREGWALVALDSPVDTTTPSGEAMANVLAVFAQFERRLIGQRTRDALAAKRAAGQELGRPLSVPPDVVRKIKRRHKAGTSLAAIARELNDAGVPTAHGGRQWWPSTVRAVLNRY